MIEFLVMKNQRPYEFLSRDLESTNNKVWFDSVDSDAFKCEIIVEGRVNTSYAGGTGESRDEF
ncbi:hypothetical protein TorRG33x02_272170 [Trema orientale]|uniref:Uncharacterized protein n=1 Tax=Trema orientale TaxID=63057 RepID=A0A2P5CV12_TREOI|nr:hypothetical protein TorRG33x02_272170 [Trema orientale]